EIAPLATVAFPVVTATNPELPSSDHWCCDPATTEAIESVQAWVALMFTASPFIESSREEVLVALDGTDATAAIWTFTRGGTVTVTVCVRLTEEPCCARAGTAMAAVPSASATIAYPSRAIYRVSARR